MKKSELKKVLKPIVKECIQETLLEGGLLSSVISEVAKGLGATQQMVVEQPRHNEDEMKKMQDNPIPSDVRQDTELRNIKAQLNGINDDLEYIKRNMYGD